MKLVLQIAFGIVLAGVIGFAARVAVVSYGVHVAEQELEEQVAAMKQAAEAKQAAEQARQRQLDLQKQEAAQRARARSEYERKKELAWNAYYVPPKDCGSFRSDRHMVECTNDKMRARKEFDLTYDPGKITTMNRLD